MPEPTYTIHLEDCVAGMAEHLEPESVDLTVTSIPFAALFQYSGKTEDIGNCADGVDFRSTQFGLHFRFFLEQLYRVMAPGSVSCIHIQQLITTQTEHGYMGRRDFRGAIVDMFSTAGFIWSGETVIPKNPQVIAQRQKLHSLLFVTGKRDARKLAPAVNDFVLFFRKPGEGRPVPALYDAEKNPGGWLTTEEWIRDAHGVWTDIRETDVLTGWQSARESDEEKHVCPLQLEVIRRCIRLYSNPGDLVMDPFMGIGSTAVVAIEQGRNAVGFELKESYHRQAIANSEKALRDRQVDAGEMPLLAALEHVS
jgi:DNA modification methylase